MNHLGGLATTLSCAGASYVSFTCWRSKGATFGPLPKPVKKEHDAFDDVVLPRTPRGKVNREGTAGMPPFRILVAEDFEPFRRFTCSTLEKRCDLQIVCEVSNGLEAVQKAGELKPDLILMDIGLPVLNGIEAARRILKVCPQSKIIFLTQESSADVVQEALNVGARGYVLKTKAGSDLLAAVDAVIMEKKFVRGI
jgi:CheY-like chemotaxis protein